jgi:putative phosphoesterase
MRLLVLSDSHGRADRIREAVSRARGADMILFLGDGLRDLALLEDGDAARLCAVRGNCDGSLFFSDDVPEERFLALDAYHILMMHGHTHDVKYGIDRAVAYAAARGADALLYGHTHERKDTYLPAGTVVGKTVLEKPMHVFNPGSIGLPNGSAPSYGWVDLRPQGIVCSHGTLA